MSKSRPYAIFSFDGKAWRKGKGRYSKVETAAKTAQRWLDSGLIKDARVMEHRADGVWTRRWPPIKPIVDAKKGN